MKSGWTPSSQVSLQIPWNQWSFDQSDCHSNFVDNLIDTVGEGVESDISCGEIGDVSHQGRVVVVTFLCQS